MHVPGRSQLQLDRESRRWFVRRPIAASLAATANSTVASRPTPCHPTVFATAVISAAPTNAIPATIHSAAQYTTPAAGGTALPAASCAASFASLLRGVCILDASRLFGAGCSRHVTHVAVPKVQASNARNATFEIEV